MLQTSDNIEASTMTYVFDMFGKSVTQMLQASINQQTAIDELRSQIRSCQTQITNICGTLEEFEDRIFVKLQEMRPTIYTRDGLPLDDALEMIQNKVQLTAEKSVTQDEALNRLDAEVKGKLDIEQFESTNKAANEASEALSDISMTIQSIQKELQKQRQDSDSMMDRCTQLVQLQVQRFGTQVAMGGDNDELGGDNSNYVTKAKFKEAIAKLKNGGGGLGGGDSDIFDENDLEGTLEKLKAHSNDLDDEYKKKKLKLDANLNKVLNLLGDEENEEDEYEYFDSNDFDIGTDFDINEVDEEEKEVRDIGIGVSGNPNEDEEIEIGESRTHKASPGKRRNIGLACDRDQTDMDENGEEEDGEPGKNGGKHKRKKMTKKQKLLEEARRQKNQAGKGGVADTSRSRVDESKLSASILANVMNKIEPILVDLFSTTGIGGVKLDKADAKQLVSQLMVLSQLRDDMTKLKMLISIKYDRVEAENELAIRITRDEFFNMLLSLFPSNTALQKAYQNYRKRLPPLKNTGEKEHQKTKFKSSEEGDEKSYTIHQRQIKTAVPAALVPARNSRLLALNSKFLKGADGKYYLRDIGAGDTTVQTQSIVGSSSKSTSVGPDQAFDFQPFLPVSAMKEQVDRINVPSQHRSRTPPDPND